MYGLDFETYSDVDLPTVGLDNYVNSPNFQPLIGAIAEVNSWGSITSAAFELWPGSSERAAFYQKLRNHTARVLAAHNAMFEEVVMRREGWWLDQQMVDTAVLSRCQGASSSLEKAGPQLLGMHKMEVGRNLIKKFCTGPTPPTPESVKDDPDWELFKQYCRVDAKVSLSLALENEWSSEETPYRNTADMNLRGWYVDMPAVERMMELVERNQQQALEEFRELHDPKGELNLNSTPQLAKWCADRKIKAKSFNEENVERLLGILSRRSTLTPDQQAVWDMLRTKQILGGSAVKKLPVIKELTSKVDGRLRHQYIHAGAGQTRRATGVGAQLQNLKRLNGLPRDMSELFDPDCSWTNTDIADNLRQVFMAEHPDSVLVVADFSSVESRGLAYLAGAEWKLDAFRKGRDMYKVQATLIYHISYDAVTKEQRGIGKVGELSCGYGAGSGAVHDFAKGMHVPLSLEQAQTLVDDYRRTNPEIVNLWNTLDQLLDQAVGSDILGDPTPQIREELGNGLFISLTVTRSLDSITALNPLARDVHIKLENGFGFKMERVFRGVYRRGRQICYHKPSPNVNGPLWKDDYIDPKTKQRRFYSIYGGKLAGILTQSLCREIFVNSVAHIEEELTLSKQGQLIGQFHDEIIIETSPENQLDQAAFAYTIRKQMRKGAANLPGFPLDAEVHCDRRYIK